MGRGAARALRGAQPLEILYTKTSEIDPPGTPEQSFKRPAHHSSSPRVNPTSPRVHVPIMTILMSE